MPAMTIGWDRYDAAGVYDELISPGGRARKGGAALKAALAALSDGDCLHTNKSNKKDTASAKRVSARTRSPQNPIPLPNHRQTLLRPRSLSHAAPLCYPALPCALERQINIMATWGSSFSCATPASADLSTRPRRNAPLVHRTRPCR